MIDAKEYIEKVNEIQQKIKVIKSADCIMDYDEKTELINALKVSMNLTAEAFAIKANQGV